MSTLTALPWDVTVVAAPLIGALLAFMRPRLGALAGVLVMLICLGAGAALAARVTGTGPIVHPVGGWIPPLGITLRVDGLSVLMLLITAVVGLASSLYALGYMRLHGAGQRERFWPLWLFLFAALNALFVSGDAFNLYVTLELLGLAAVSLVALAGSSQGLGAAMRYLLVSLLGSLSYLLGVGLLYGAYATVDLSLLAERVQAGPVAWTAMGLMSAGLIMKSALFPLHFWLPPAHASAPAPVSAVLSALVVKASFYILLRLWFQVFPAAVTSQAAALLGALGAGAVLWGALQALRAQRLKPMVAYSTVAQLGYLFLLFPLAQGAAGAFTAWAGGIYLAISHACAKAAMFLTAGAVLHAAGHDRIAELGGTAQRMPVSMFALALAGVSLIGLPPSGGFIGKWLLLNAALGQGQWWAVAVLLGGSVLGAAYIFRVVGHAFGHVAAPPAAAQAPPIMEWSALALALLAVLLGIASAGPVALLRIGAPVAGAVLVEMAP